MDRTETPAEADMLAMAATPPTAEPGTRSQSGKLNGRRGDMGGEGALSFLRSRGWILAFALLALVAAVLATVGPSPQAAAQWLLASRNWVNAHLVAAALGFAATYVVFTALSWPAAWILSVAGGALFGPWLGVPLVSLSSTAGATVAMLVSRHLLRGNVEERFPGFIAGINDGLAKDGVRYLLAARLTPVIPFFAINLAVGLTRMRVATFACVTLVGALPLVLLYVTAGEQFATIRSPWDIVGWRILLALFALATTPFVLKGMDARRRTRASLEPWPRPGKFDFNLIVVGAGSAGLVSAYVAATARARVALIEQGEMGGDCLNTGCVPSKALIRSAKLAAEARNAAHYGLRGALDADFPAIMARLRGVIAKIAPQDSVERYRSLGVFVLKGRARVLDPWTVEVDGRRLKGRRIILATGAEPAIPPIPGLSEVMPLTSETLWGLAERPSRLLIVGAAQSVANWPKPSLASAAIPRWLRARNES